MKYAVILTDGAADTPVKELGGKTPLEAANKPNIDKLAGLGEMGMVKTVPGDLPPGSDVANLAVFGYDPEIYYTGRSPLEAVSMKVPLKLTDTTFRTNLVSLSDEPEYEKKTMVDYSSDEITTAEAHQLIDEFRAEGAEKAGVFLSAVALLVLLLGEKGKIQQRIEGQASAFDVKDGLQHGEQEKRPCPAGQCARLEIRIGEKQVDRIAVGKSEPSLLRLGGQIRKSAAAAAEHRAAGNPLMDGKDSAQ